MVSANFKFLVSLTFPSFHGAQIKNFQLKIKNENGFYYEDALALPYKTE